MRREPQQQAKQRQQDVRREAAAGGHALMFTTIRAAVRLRLHTVFVVLQPVEVINVYAAGVKPLPAKE
jgi:hypothetical protein